MPPRRPSPKKKSTRAKGAHPIEVRWRPKVKFAGPPHEEDHARLVLTQHMADLLRVACARFGHTMQPEIWAERIVNGTSGRPGFPYVPFPKSVIRIAELDVDYKNARVGSPGKWKVWVRVRDAVDISLGHAGDHVSLWKGI